MAGDDTIKKLVLKGWMIVNGGARLGCFIFQQTGGKYIAFFRLNLVLLIFDSPV